MRIPWPAVLGGTVVAALGAAGLIRGAMPQSAAAGPSSSAAGAISVTNPYVRAPVPPSHTAAAYFTIYNNTATADRLTDVQTGAGTDAVLHTLLPDGTMVAAANGVLIPPHGKYVLSTGKGHVMIEGVYGTLRAGQTVNLELDFRNAGPIDVVAPVIAVGARAPGGN